MKFGLQGLTLGGLLAVTAALTPAHAAPMVLDFEAGTLQQPVGSLYAGFSFTGSEEVRDDTMFTASPFAPSVKFVVSSTSFVVDVLDTAATPFNSLYFDYAGGLFAYIYDTNDKKTTIQIDQGAAPIWYELTDPVTMLKSPVLLDKATRIDYIEFTYNGTAGGEFGIDNLTFDLQPGSVFPPPPNPVPEPAGFALAALALLGAGLATRRRR